MKKRGKKIQNLLMIRRKGVPLFTSYLKKEGYSKELLHLYVKSGWIKRLAKGVYIEVNSEMTLDGLVFALQKQLSLKIFPAGKTALNLLGVRQYVLQTESGYIAFCYNSPNKIPKYAKTNQNLRIHYSRLFEDEDLGLTRLTGELPLSLSTRERAILETIFVVKSKEDFKEAQDIMELLPDLRGKLVQELLMACRHIRTKRLFLFLAKDTGHRWYSSLDLKAMDLGNGPREIIKNGMYDKEFKITIPRDHYEHQ